MVSLSRFPSVRAFVAAAAMLQLQPAQAQELGDTIFQRYRTLRPSIEKAGEEVEAHQFDQAQELLGPVLKQVPDHAVAHFLLATMAYENRDFRGALDHIETSERSLKDLRERYAKLVADINAKDDAAASDTKTALEYLNGTGWDSIQDILNAKQQDLNYLEAKKKGLASREAPFAVPAVYSFLHGNCLYRLGRASEAAAQYQLAVQSDPSNAKAWNNLVALYWETKDQAQARATLAKAEAAGVAIVPGLKRSVLEAK